MLFCNAYEEGHYHSLHLSLTHSHTSFSDPSPVNFYRRCYIYKGNIHPSSLCTSSTEGSHRGGIYPEWTVFQNQVTFWARHTQTHFFKYKWETPNKNVMIGVLQFLSEQEISIPYLMFWPWTCVEVMLSPWNIMEMFEKKQVTDILVFICWFNALS